MPTGARWAGRRWSYPVAVPVLLRAASESLIPEDHAAVPDGAIGGDGGGMLLLRDPDRDAGRNWTANVSS